MVFAIKSWNNDYQILDVCFSISPADIDLCPPPEVQSVQPLVGHLITYLKKVVFVMQELGMGDDLRSQGRSPSADLKLPTFINPENEYASPF